MRYDCLGSAWKGKGRSRMPTEYCSGVGTGRCRQVLAGAPSRCGLDLYREGTPELPGHEHS